MAVNDATTTTNTNFPSTSFAKCQHQRRSRSLLLLQALLCFAICIATLQTASAKNLDDSSFAVGGSAGVGVHNNNYNNNNHHHHSQRRRLQRRDAANIREQCDAVSVYFESIDIKLNGIYEQKGAVCGGNCCTNSTEIELRQKATTEFERLLHHHTKSLRGILESTANLFQNHVLELTKQSENKTLNVFSQVYRRMLPLSRQLIGQLYGEILNQLKYSNNNNNININNNLYNLEDVIHKFFVNLFPVAYHQAVHLNNQKYGDLHEDYISCLQHTYDDLQPFGTIPKEIKHNLVQSVQTATIFMSSLRHSAEVLSETDGLYAIHMTDTCQQQLLKMSYCPSCNGLQKAQVKTCYSYCMNVLRGCSAQYAGVLDSPWSNVVDAIDNLVTAHIRSDSGIVTTIKLLDDKLSKTIMYAMENSAELEKKVKKTCGTPKLLPYLANDNELRPMATQSIKWATPPDAEILHFLSTIDKSKEFYSNIVNNVCEDEDIQHNDVHCWTGDRIGDYTQAAMEPGIDRQRYNPAVPLETNSQSSKLNELVDKLIKIRKNIGSAIPSTTRSYSDIQSDMARHDEEGSGRMVEDVDDEEYGNLHGSGDGSGDGATSSPYDPLGPTTIITNDIEPRAGPGSTAAIKMAPLCSVVGTTIIGTLVTILLTSREGYALRAH